MGPAIAVHLIALPLVIMEFATKVISETKGSVERVTIVNVVPETFLTSCAGLFGLTAERNVASSPSSYIHCMKVPLVTLHVTDAVCPVHSSPGSDSVTVQLAGDITLNVTGVRKHKIIDNNSYYKYSGSTT